MPVSVHVSEPVVVEAHPVVAPVEESHPVVVHSVAPATLFLHQNSTVATTAATSSNPISYQDPSHVPDLGIVLFVLAVVVILGAIYAWIRA